MIENLATGYSDSGALIDCQAVSRRLFLVIKVSDFVLFRGDERVDEGFKRNDGESSGPLQGGFDEAFLLQFFESAVGLNPLHLEPLSDEARGLYPAFR